MAHIGAIESFGREDIALVGGKAANLGELVLAGLPVPPGFVVTTDAYREVITAHGLAAEIQDRAARGDGAGIRALIEAAVVPEALREELAAAYGELGSPPVAVRSSATAEDLAEASFAGQQDTYLNVRGLDALVDAVRRCWASLWTDRAMAYRERAGVDPVTVALAVVVQELVDADAAGVMFTANPVNGRRDETVVSAAWGLGEAVVASAVDTDQIVVRNGQVHHRTTADKAVLTVRTPTGTQEQPVPPDRRRLPVLDDDTALALTGLGDRIAAHFGTPQDIEWARADDELFILQARPITALPPAEADPPTTWPVPDRTAFYFRASIVEQLPDPLSPLFADLVDGSVSRSLQALMNELTGSGAVRPGDVGLPTINGYAYYVYSRSGMVRVTLRTPLAFKALGNNPKYSGRVRWRTRSRPRYEQIVARWRDRDLTALTSAELMAGVVELLDAGTEYYTAVQTIIPVAATSEVLFTRFYNAVVRRAGDPTAVTFLLGFESLPIRAEKSLADLGGWLRVRPALTEVLLNESSATLLSRLTTESDGDWPEFRRRFTDHLRDFGHLVYNLDFVNPVPADDPATVVDTLRFSVRGEAGDPYERQQRSVAAREAGTAQVRTRLGPLRRRAFDRLLHWAQEVAPEREDALAEVGLAWPPLRRLLAEIGGRLVEVGVIDQPADVYWLRQAEIAGRPTGSLADAVEQRRQVWRGRRRVTPPQMLPEGGVLRIFKNVLPATSADQTGDVLSGIGASAGRVTATARVLSGPADFAELQPGEVLVAAVTTPAWTSLFARAAAVVTDIGGPLSHSSIVAREYHIPAVLGTGVATKRIRRGQRITVDGDTGRVHLIATE